MAQLKVYGRRSVWAGRREDLSDVLHGALMAAWQLPEDKRFQRFVWLDDDDLVAPRGHAYLVVEVVAFAGRSTQAVRALVRETYARVCPAFGLPVDDLEIVVLESPQDRWGIRGVSGDELTLTYPVTL
ncbi:tautomerase family protein [Sanguibacter suaedae]|uniref:Tautomerase family protein n=1 Tax=Sanguibacter suaedae TaxID=2795737 RepID=A0A934I8T7_9MICO|nr:tautomerase family protein [Sanguibacter suaedae]MBI9114305.1 tautomerase family protein [Sanguibacter suaedae]